MIAVVRSDDEHLRQWADLHATEPPGGFVGAWLRASAAVARPLVRAGVTPNAVTVFALGAAVAAVGLAALDGWVGPASACAAVVASGLADSLDGAVAVQGGRATRVGYLLDSTLDRLADAALAAALAVVAGTTVAAWAAVAAVASAWFLEYVRARAALAAGATGGEAAGGPAPERQLVTPGERPTRIVLTALGLGIPALALAALWGQVVIVGGSALLLLGHSLRRLGRLDGRRRGSTASG